MKMGTTRSPKFRRLSRMTGMSTRETVGTLELLWLFTMEQAPAGDIGKWPDDEIEEVCDWPGEAGALISALIESGWLDECDKHRLLVHDWSEHIPEFLKLRVKRGSLTVIEEPVTRQRPDTDQSPTSRRRVAVDREGKPSQAKGSQVNLLPDPGADAPGVVSAEWGEVVDALGAYVPSRSRCIETPARMAKRKQIAERFGKTAPVDAIHGYAAMHFTRPPSGTFDPRKNFDLDTIWGNKLAKYLDADREARESGMTRPYTAAEAASDAFGSKVIDIAQRIISERGSSLAGL